MAKMVTGPVVAPGAQQEQSRDSRASTGLTGSLVVGTVPSPQEMLPLLGLNNRFPVPAPRTCHTGSVPGLQEEH